VKWLSNAVEQLADVISTTATNCVFVGQCFPFSILFIPFIDCCIHIDPILNVCARVVLKCTAKIKTVKITVGTEVVVFLLS